MGRAAVVPVAKANSDGVMASLSAPVLRDLSGQTGYGVYANSTTDLAFTALRVEVPW